jgi:hypothetical protein
MTMKCIVLEDRSWGNVGAAFLAAVALGWALAMVVTALRLPVLAVVAAQAAVVVVALWQQRRAPRDRRDVMSWQRLALAGLSTAFAGAVAFASGSLWIVAAAVAAMTAITMAWAHHAWSQERHPWRRRRLIESA